MAKRQDATPVAPGAVPGEIADVPAAAQDAHTEKLEDFRAANKRMATELAQLGTDNAALKSEVHELQLRNAELETHGGKLQRRLADLGEELERRKPAERPHELPSAYYALLPGRTDPKASNALETRLIETDDELAALLAEAEETGRAWVNDPRRL